MFFEFTFFDSGPSFSSTICLIFHMGNGFKFSNFRNYSSYNFWSKVRRQTLRPYLESAELDCKHNIQWRKSNGVLRRHHIGHSIRTPGTPEVLITTTAFALPPSGLKVLFQAQKCKLQKTNREFSFKRWKQ